MTVTEPPSHVGPHSSVVRLPVAPGGFDRPLPRPFAVSSARRRKPGGSGRPGQGWPRRLCWSVLAEVGSSHQLLESSVPCFSAFFQTRWSYPRLVPPPVWAAVVPALVPPGARWGRFEGQLLLAVGVAAAWGAETPPRAVAGVPHFSLPPDHPPPPPSPHLPPSFSLCLPPAPHPFCETAGLRLRGLLSAVAPGGAVRSSGPRRPRP